MKQTKLTYLSPVTETLVVQSEGSMCNNPSINALNHTQYLIGAIDDGYEEL